VIWELSAAPMLSAMLWLHYILRRLCCDPPALSEMLITDLHGWCNRSQAGSLSFVLKDCRCPNV
jgi:hypothetical protein